MNRVNLGLFTANLNSGNMGCNALTYSAILLLEEVAELLHLSFSYTLFCSDAKDCTSNYGRLAGCDIRFVVPAFRRKDKIKAFLKRDFKLIRNFNLAIDECDVFLEIAGGDSYSDIYGISRQLLYNKCHALTMKKKAPLIFLPQTIGPFRSDKAKSIASKGLSYAEHIFTRDPISYEKAVHYSNSSSVSQTIDMAFFMDYEQCKRTATKPRIGINPSGLLWNGGYTGNNQFGLQVDYKELIDRLISTINPEHYEIVLVPHVLHGPIYHVEDDYKVCKSLQRKYPHCQVAPFFYTPVEAKSFVSGLDLLIGSRMHCCIAAYSSGVPIYPLAYSRKFKGLFKDGLEYPYGAELVSDDTDTILDSLKVVLDNLVNIQSEMPTRLQKLQAYKTDLIQSLMHIMERTTT